MKAKKSEQELKKHVNDAASKIKNHLEKLTIRHPKKAELISYWIHDFTKMIDFEDKFNPSKNKRYKKGDIIKVNLGFNIGSEQGGLHYAVVLEKENSILSPVITVAPLTSIDLKKNTKKGNRHGEINLGNELYTKLINKCETKIDKCKQCIKDFKDADPENSRQSLAKSQKYKTEAENTLKEINKMKAGSVCLINQITTISKIRIYNPKKNRDVLHGVRLSNETLDIIDENIKTFFLKS